MSSSVHNRFVSVTIKNNDAHDIIETKSIDETPDTNTCTICYSDIDDNSKATLKCGHMYHTGCYTSYIAYNIVHKKQAITCPVCRDDILEIVVNKPEVIHIISGDEENDIESQSIYDDDNLVQSGCCLSAQCCGLFVLRLMMVGAVYCVLHFTIYCADNSC